jgi:CDGSH-type Zn-finger protein
MPAMCHCHRSRNYPFCDGSHKGSKGTLNKDPQIQEKKENFIFTPNIATEKSAAEEENI